MSLYLLYFSFFKTLILFIKYKQIKDSEDKLESYNVYDPMTKSLQVFICYFSASEKRPALGDRGMTASLNTVSLDVFAVHKISNKTVT